MISTSGGDGSRVLSVVGDQLVRGLQLEPVLANPGAIRLTGAPQESGWSYFYLRVIDADGDPAWKSFKMFTTGGPGTLVDVEILGPYTASELPISTTYDLDPNVTWTGLDIGRAFQPSGGSAQAGADGVGVRVDTTRPRLHFAVSQGGQTAADSTLASALQDEEFFQFTVQPQPGNSLDLRQATFQLEWVRHGYHAPRAISFFTSVEGFTEADAIYTHSLFASEGEPSTIEFQLPDTVAYSDISTAVEFRIYFHGSQYAHDASLLGLKLTRHLREGTYARWAADNDWQAQSPALFDDSDDDGMTNLLEYGLGFDPMSANQAAPAITAYNNPSPSLSGSSRVSIDYNVNPNANDTTVHFEGCTDFTDWVALTPNGSTIQLQTLETIQTTAGLRQRMRMTIDTTSPYQFFRLRVPAPN
jgi:hypothetical protein